jgi:hypothetical protein
VERRVYVAFLCWLEVLMQGVREEPNPLPSSRHVSAMGACQMRSEVWSGRDVC